MLSIYYLLIILFLLLAVLYLYLRKCECEKVILRDNLSWDKSDYNLTRDPTVSQPSYVNDGPYVGALSDAGQFNYALYYPDASLGRNSIQTEELLGLNFSLG